MIITAKEIEQRLNKEWPQLNQIWCFDQKYICPKVDEVESELKNGLWLDINSIEAENPDCDDFALQQHAVIKCHFNWSFGEAFANRIRGWFLLHNLNICVCQESILLIDPKPRKIWKPNDLIEDNVLWVRM